MYLDDLAKIETQNLTTMEHLENEVLSFTANALTKSLREHFQHPERELDITTVYAATYENAIKLAWLTGQVHVIRMIGEGKIELASDSITLSDMDVPFKEAIEALEAMVPTESDVYKQLEANIKLKAFTVAAVSERDAVNRVKKLYEDALKSGQSRSEVMQNVDAFLNTAGVTNASPYYLELHYRNNMMSAYNAGRWTQVANNDLVQFLAYSSVLDDGTTELCRHLDNVVKAKDDKFWETYYPPNHHKCRGTVSPLSPRQYAALPDSVKAQSNQVTNQSVSDDSTMNKEHIFRSSPVVSMSTIPKALLERAAEYGLTQKILKQSAVESAAILDTQTKALGKRKVKAPLVSDDLEPFKEMITNNLASNPDEILMGFESMDEEMDFPALYYLLDLDGTNTALGIAPAYNEAAFLELKSLTAEQVEQLREQSIPLPE